MHLITMSNEQPTRYYILLMELYTVKNRERLLALTELQNKIFLIPPELSPERITIRSLLTVHAADIDIEIVVARCDARVLNTDNKCCTLQLSSI